MRRLTLLGLIVSPLALLALVHCSDDPDAGSGPTLDASSSNVDVTISLPTTLPPAGDSGSPVDAGVDSGPRYDDAGCVYEPGAAPVLGEQGVATNGLVLWLWAEHGVATTDAGAVCHWDDLSGTALGFKPSATAPALADNALRGKKAISFVGKEDLSRGDVLGIAAGAARTVAVFGSVADTGRRFHYFLQGQGGTGGIYFGLDQNTYSTVGHREGVYTTNNAYDSNVTTDGLPHAHLFSISSFAPGGSLPGVLYYSIDGNATTLTRTSGGTGNGSVEDFSGANFTALGAADDIGFGGAYLGEILVWNRALDATERAQVVTHFAAHYPQ